MNRPVTAALLAALVALLSLASVAPAGARTSRAACLRKASHARTASARSRARARCRKPAAKAATATMGVETVPATAPAAAPVTRAPATAAAAAPALTAIQQGLVDCANGARAQARLPALRVDGALTRAAQAFAGDMSARNFFDHITPEGLAPWDRIAAVLNGEAPFGTMGENIALGYADAPATCTGWMNSAGHRANILDPDFTAIGTGWVGGYAVQDFGG